MKRSRLTEVPTQVTSEKLRKAIEAMRSDGRFSDRRKRRELILQSGRLSEIEQDAQREVITQDNERVALLQLFYALEELAGLGGINNFIQFIESFDLSE